MATRNWATHCDTEVHFFATEDAAISQANNQIGVCREERSDGWDEETTEGICVMRVVSRAGKVNPDAHYSVGDYALQAVENERSQADVNEDQIRRREILIKREGQQPVTKLPAEGYEAAIEMCREVLAMNPKAIVLLCEITWDYRLWCQTAEAAVHYYDVAAGKAKVKVG